MFKWYYYDFLKFSIPYDFQKISIAAPSRYKAVHVLTYSKLSLGITEALYLASEGVGVKLFPEMRNSMGLCGVCLLYASMGYLNVIWGGVSIPDNRGKVIHKPMSHLY